MNIETKLSEGVQLILSGKASQAIDHFKEIISKSPGNPYALFYWGIAEKECGNLDAAIDLIRLALQNDPKEYQFHFHLGEIFSKIGKDEETIFHYRNVVELHPEMAEAHFRLGVALQKINQPDEAIKSFQLAIANDPMLGEAHNNIGAIYIEQKKYKEALSHLQTAVSITPDLLSAYKNMARCYLKIGEKAKALRCYDKILSAAPKHAEVLILKGDLLLSQHRFDDAYRQYLKASALKKDAAFLHHRMAEITSQQNKLDKAVWHYLKAIEINPQNENYYHSIGQLYIRLGEKKKAARSFEKAVKRNPMLADAHLNLGHLLKDFGETKAAIIHLKKAITLRPDDIAAHNDLGNAYLEQGDPQNASLSYQQAVDMDPLFAEAHFNLGHTLIELGELNVAIAHLEKAIDIKPDFHHAKLCLSFCWMLLGDSSKGLRYYEERLNVNMYRGNYPYRDRRKWDGKPFSGKRLLIHAEQGIGDILYFIRYIPIVKSKGGTVIFEIPLKMFELLKGMPGVDEFALRTDKQILEVDFDMYAPLASLSYLLGSQKISPLPAEAYLNVDDRLVKLWRKRLGQTSKIRIGICWQGNPLYYGDSQRSFSLANFFDIARMKTVQLYSLQKYKGTEQLKDLPNDVSIINLGETLDNDGHCFLDTAAVMKHLDLVITSDTAIAHLAGTLGIRVWTILKYVPEWRWGLNGSSHPWYPTIRLFRQTEPGNWAEVFRQVKEAVETDLTC